MGYVRTTWVIGALIAVCALLAFAAPVVAASAPGTAVKGAAAARVAAASGAQREQARRAATASLGPVVGDAGCAANALFANDDGSTPEVALPFTLDFFGTSYSSLWVNNNGNVTFSGPLSTYTPFAITATTPPIIAPFLADVDTRSPESGLVTYGTTTFQGHTAFCVDWPHVGYFAEHADKLNDFQLLLVNRSDAAAGAFDIVFNYGQVQWETGDFSGGVDGFGGTSAGAGFSDGDGDPAHFFQLSGIARERRVPRQRRHGADPWQLRHERARSLPLPRHRRGLLGGEATDLSRPWPALGDGYSFVNRGLPGYLSPARLSVGDVLTPAGLASTFSDWIATRPLTAASRRRSHGWGG